jgi:hypothetical protein
MLLDMMKNVPTTSLADLKESAGMSQFLAPTLYEACLGFPGPSLYGGILVRSLPTLHKVAINPRQSRVYCTGKISFGLQNPAEIMIHTLHGTLEANLVSIVRSSRP